MTRLTDSELEAEWVRAAAVVGIHGPYSFARHAAIAHRFLTTPHYDQEPEMKIPAEAPAANILQYSNDIANIPTVRIPFRLEGYQAGWAAYVKGGKFETAAEAYDRDSREDGIPVARRRSAYNGFKDGWNAAKEAKHS